MTGVGGSGKKQLALMPIDTTTAQGRLVFNIFASLAHSLSHPEITTQLALAPGTGRNYVSEIFAKLGVSDQAQAAVMVVKLGLL
jgi:DNA-binding CsgD family transcriptional regulator